MRTKTLLGTIATLGLAGLIASALPKEDSRFPQLPKARSYAWYTADLEDKPVQDASLNSARVDSTSPSPNPELFDETNETSEDPDFYLYNQIPTTDVRGLRIIHDAFQRPVPNHYFYAIEQRYAELVKTQDPSTIVQDWHDVGKDMYSFSLNGQVTYFIPESIVTVFRRRVDEFAQEYINNPRYRDNASLRTAAENILANTLIGSSDIERTTNIHTGQLLNAVFANNPSMQSPELSHSIQTNVVLTTYTPGSQADEHQPLYLHVVVNWMMHSALWIGLSLMSTQVKTVKAVTYSELACILNLMTGSNQ